MLSHLPVFCFFFFVIIIIFFSFFGTVSQSVSQKSLKPIRFSLLVRSRRDFVKDSEVFVKNPQALFSFAAALPPTRVAGPFVPFSEIASIFSREEYARAEQPPEFPVFHASNQPLASEE